MNKNVTHRLLRQKGLSILREILPQRKIQEIAHLEYPQERKRGLTSGLYFGLLVWAQIEKSIGSIDELLSGGLGKIEEIYQTQTPLVTKQAMSWRSKKLPWRMFKSLYEYLVDSARRDNLLTGNLYQDIYQIKLIDSSLLDVVARLIGTMASKPSKRFKSGKLTKGQVKLKTVFNWSGRIPELIHLSKASTGELSGVKRLIKKAIKRAKAVILVFDLGFFSYEFLSWLVSEKIYFVSRIKANTRYEVIKELGPHEWLVKLGITAEYQKAVVVRLVKVKEKDLWYYYITNMLDRKRIRKRQIRLLYRRRWQVEIFFKELKHILNIRKIFFHNPNGVKGQIYIGLSVYVLGKILIARSAQKHGVKSQDISFGRAITAIRIWLNHHSEKIFCTRPRRALVNELLDKIYNFAYIKKKRIPPCGTTSYPSAKGEKDVA
jgi:hypothetical protein